MLAMLVKNLFVDPLGCKLVQITLIHFSDIWSHSDMHNKNNKLYLYSTYKNRTLSYAEYSEAKFKQP